MDMEKGTLAGFCQLCQQKQAQYQDICTQKNLCLQCISYIQKQQEHTTHTDLQNTESTATNVSLSNMAPNNHLMQPGYGQKLDSVQTAQQRDNLSGKDQDLLVGNMKAPQTPPKGYQQGYLLNMWQYQQQMMRNQRQVPYIMGYYPYPYPPQGQPQMNDQRADAQNPHPQCVYPYPQQPYYNLEETGQDLGINKQQMLKHPQAPPPYTQVYPNGQMVPYYGEQPALMLPQAGELPNPHNHHNPHNARMMPDPNQHSASNHKRPFPSTKGYEVHLDSEKKQKKERGGVSNNKKKELEQSPQTKQKMLQEQEDKAREQLIIHQQLCEQYQPEEHLTRQERVMRYVEKKRSKRFQKFIRYESRKKHALIRPRIKGRFAKREEVEALKRLMETGRFRASKPMKYFLPDQDHNQMTDFTDSNVKQQDNLVPQTDEQWNEVFNNLSDADWDNVLATM